ncbi:MAG: hypothetical protein ACRD47_10495, partial [Nitrososphaeraceae archaeon]
MDAIVGRKVMSIPTRRNVSFGEEHMMNWESLKFTRSNKLYARFRIQNKKIWMAQGLPVNKGLRASRGRAKII